jgi:DNA-binding PadR family transcriptional regulator
MRGPYPPPPHPFAMAAVPKGFLRYYILRLLSERPMAGSEIMNEIGKRTHGHWKPSPGSIYPLLAWLHDKGYTKEVMEPDSTIKRYTLTDSGKVFLEKLAGEKQELGRRIGFFAPPFLGPQWFEDYPKNARELIEAGTKLVMSSWALLDRLRERYSEEGAAKATKVLEDAAQKLEEIVAGLKG